MKTTYRLTTGGQPRIPRQVMVLLVRALHGLITAFFLTCIGYIYYAGITNHNSPWAYVAAGFLVLEGLVVALNHGDCPLGAVHRKYGDNKAFFELFLPQSLAKKAVPFFGIVAGLGFLLLFL